MAKRDIGSRVDNPSREAGHAGRAAGKGSPVSRHSVSGREFAEDDLLAVEDGRWEFEARIMVA